MQNIIIDKPYHFVPPRDSRLWPAVFNALLPRHLRKNYGLDSYEFLGLERLQASRQAGDGIMLASNHCRPCDPMVILMLARQISQPVFIMASWHLFMQSRFQSFVLPRMGAFSLYREGLDRESLKYGIQVLARAQRPLVVFPEGVVTRTNDRLGDLMDGTGFLARNAAKQRVSLGLGGRVVIHPVAIRYFFRGNLEEALRPVLEEIEKRLSWRPRRHLPLRERITRIGEALLTLKELEYLGQPQNLPLEQRMSNLIDCILHPLEKEWLKGRREGDTVFRVKNLRSAILPDMVAGEITEAERARRWEQLADTYLAQQVHLYPSGYFDPIPSTEQLLETVERFEEDLTDTARVHRPLHVVVEVGEAIEVSPQRERNVEADPLMTRLRGDLQNMLARLKSIDKGD